MTTDEELSTQEQNLVIIYHSGTRAATVSQLREALSYMEEHDAQTVRVLIGKLEHLGDSDFAVLAPEEVCV